MVRSNSLVKPEDADRQAHQPESARPGQTARRHTARVAAGLRRHWLAAALLAVGLALRVLV